jgi:adenosylhomocysteine nucleosidase
MINIVTALPCEARPLIDAFRLQKRSSIHAFPLYERDGLNLIVCGPGKLAAATAVAYLQGLQQAQPASGWLNLGIAGSSAFAVGDMVLAHRVIDNNTGQRFYPGLCFELPCATAEVITVDVPETRYAGNAVYDMEAAGFYSAAMRFAPGDVIHCLKVISDTHEHAIETINEARVQELICNTLPMMQQTLSQLDKLASELHAINAMPDAFEDIRARWRFTIAQQNQLKNLLWRWQALSAEPITNAIDFKQCKHGKQVLQYIESRIDGLPISF